MRLKQLAFSDTLIAHQKNGSVDQRPTSQDVLQKATQDVELVKAQRFDYWIFHSIAFIRFKRADIDKNSMSEPPRYSRLSTSK
ncbi:hypothetical protein ED208_05075 [Stagnimonas aquatica]|uniref:Uncharacterized protein n=1 Tax=Stagnimonas aquatica TaxID=2689987 RepID=A0A3N0VGE6_9GAMM|nr:hypothetical protein ED208_05075 [Stagnimonas aquatica]